MMWFLIVLSCAIFVATEESLAGPACRLVAHTGQMNIPDCGNVTYTINICSGYCNSSALATSLDGLDENARQSITPRSRLCCNVDLTEDLPTTVMCPNGPRTFHFLSATSCGCSYCREVSH